MNARQLLSLFDRIGEAEDAVPRLRRFILDLAVRGKLVPQDANEEPASELLIQVAAEKARRTRAGEVRGSKALHATAVDHGPLSLPPSWRWSCLSEIGVLSPRNEAADRAKASFVPMAMIAAEYGVAHSHQVRPWGDIKKGYTHFAEGDVGLAKITPCFENAKSTVFRNLAGGIGAGTTELHVVRPLIVNPDYILIFLKCPYFIEAGIPRMTGTAGQKRVPVEYFAGAPFPLPPVAEQRRIVARVDELMALCDRLEAARAEREAIGTRLTTASLARLNEPNTDPFRFSGDARFALDNLAALTRRPDQVGQLREAVLSLAVRGFLVRQDRNDKPAPRFECGDLSGQGDRLELELPTGWSWARVSDVADSRLGKMLDKAKNRGSRYRYLRNTNVHWFDIRLDDLKTIALADDEVETYALRSGDVLICEGGHGIGRTAVLEQSDAELVFQKALHRVRPGMNLDGHFFSFCVFVYFRARILQKYFTGVGIPHFTGRALDRLVFPLPPIAEQRRIVAKAMELVSLCNRLAMSLARGEESRSRLLEAVLHEALAPSMEEAA
jgi:type I restriction enzyme S subunit